MSTYYIFTLLIYCGIKSTLKSSMTFLNTVLILASIHVIVRCDEFLYVIAFLYESCTYTDTSLSDISICTLSLYDNFYCVWIFVDVEFFQITCFYQPFHKHSITLTFILSYSKQDYMLPYAKYMVALSMKKQWYS